ncbi:hypothetical protein F5B22DRAFT_354506 [Xylaria bambusicola]|uniref:uncharacterized protein n=1 Tax=Xylaria bambusicola TaxID=326684 RepID=UPI002008BD84|nr:uncharacterized protein F5B22DRAFT_354506 [Xylaria bambusicola]KAI0525668.1 hypothetical protein F5B22DRAFT_354506 [Xylaria bambusicola]
MDLGSVEDTAISPSAPSSELLSPPPLLDFLSLPLEIRLEIYTHLLTIPSNPSHPLSAPTPVSSSPHAPFFLQQDPPAPLYPSIIRTCRQLHAECLPVLYKSNMFLAHATLLTVFPSLFSPSHPRKTYAPVRSPSLASLVTRFRVRVRLDAEPQFARDEVTAQFSGKSELVIETWQTEWRAAGPDVLRLFEGVRGIRVAKVIGSTSGFEEYAWWLERAMMARAGDHVAPFPEQDGAGRGTFRR